MADEFGERRSKVKKLLFLSLTALLASCSSTQKFKLAKIQALDTSKRLLVAVLDFSNQSGDAQNDRYVEGLAGSMIEELRQTGRFRLVERQKLAELMKELKLSLTGVIDETKAKEIGQQLGVDGLLIGNLVSIGHKQKKPTLGIVWVESRTTEVVLDARLVDVESGEILVSSKRSAFITQRKWVAFFFARIGAISDEAYQFQKAAAVALKQIANDLAAQAPSK